LNWGHQQLLTDKVGKDIWGLVYLGNDRRMKRNLEEGGKAGREDKILKYGAGVQRHKIKQIEGKEGVRR